MPPDEYEPSPSMGSLANEFLRRRGPPRLLTRGVEGPPLLKLFSALLFFRGPFTKRPFLLPPWFSNARLPSLTLPSARLFFFTGTAFVTAGAGARRRGRLFFFTETAFVTAGARRRGRLFFFIGARRGRLFFFTGTAFVFTGAASTGSFFLPFGMGSSIPSTSRLFIMLATLNLRFRLPVGVGGRSAAFVFLLPTLFFLPTGAKRGASKRRGGVVCFLLGGLIKRGFVGIEGDTTAPPLPKESGRSVLVMGGRASDSLMVKRGGLAVTRAVEVPTGLRLFGLRLGTVTNAVEVTGLRLLGLGTVTNAVEVPTGLRLLGLLVKESGRSVLAMGGRVIELFRV